MSTPSVTERAKPSLPIGGVALAGVLAIYALWVLTVEFLRPAVSLDERFPPNISEPEQAAARASATTAARVGMFRGDLWRDRALVDAALAFSTLPSIDNARIEGARSAALRAVSVAPIDARAWLILAATASSQSLASERIFEPLKMSYYTGPNERKLMDARLRLAVRTRAFEQPELADAMRREIRAILRGAPELRAAILESYRQAGVSGREFLLSAIAGIDPEFEASLRSSG